MANQIRRRTRGLEDQYMSLNPPTFIREATVILIAGAIAAGLVAVAFYSFGVIQ